MKTLHQCALSRHLVPFGLRLVGIRNLVLLHFALLLISCAEQTASRGASLSRDDRKLSIDVLDRSVGFIAPPGWRMIQQPDNLNAVYVFSRTSKDKHIELSVSCALGSMDTDTPEAERHKEELRIRRLDFPDSGFRPVGVASTANGREVNIYHYTSDGQHLIAIIPEKGIATTISLSAQSNEGLAANRHALDKLISTYHNGIQEANPKDRFER